MKLRKLISDFTKILETYILNIEIERNKFSRNTTLLKICNDRNLPKTFDQSLEEIRSSNENPKERDAHYFFRKVFIDVEEWRFLAGKLKDPETYIKKISGSIDDLFLYEKIICNYNICTLRNSFNKEVIADLNLTEEAVAFITKNEDHFSKNKKVIYSYFLSYMMVSNFNESENYFKYKKFILNNLKWFSFSELEAYYLNMYSYSIQKVNKGDRSFLKEMMDVFKFLDENIDSIRYMFGFNIYYLNAINTGMGLKEYKWVEKFMNKHKDNLPKENRDDVYNLGMANFYFFKNNFDEALKHLIRSDYPNYTYYLMAKVLIIKIYFEKKDFEGVLSTIDAVKHYLKRKDLIPERLIRSNSNFLNCVIKLIDKNKKNSILNAESMVKKDMSISNREWVIAKIEELNRF